MKTGEYIVINSAARKIWYFNGAKREEYSANTDPSHDTYLFAESGKSKIQIEMDGANSGSLTGSWRQYGL